MKKLVFLAILLVGFAATGFGQGLAIGSTMENFSMTDTDGKARTLNELKGPNGAAVIFLSAQCPVVKDYNSRISEIASDYAAKGIPFIGINSNATESLDWVSSNAAENYKFPVLIDKGNIFADLVGANVTPEVFYVNANNVLEYHGAIDNDRSGKNIKTQYLRTAFDSALSGKPIERATALAFGCTIKRVAVEK